MLISNVVSGRSKNDKVVIGLIGTHKGVGVTHFGIMLSNYLSKHKRLKTAYLEMNEEDDIKYLLYAYESNMDKPKEVKEFNIFNTTYYKNVRDPEFIKILNERYEYFILDFGMDFNRNKNEFLRCDVKLVIGSTTEWKRDYLFRFIENKRELPSFPYWKYLIVFGQKKDLRIASSELHIKLNCVGYEPDPFLLSKETKELFQKIIFPS